MVTETFSGMIQGIDGLIVTIQADISDGLPVFNMVGMLSSEVKEARERIRTAFKNTGLRLPAKRIAVNLAPADVKKQGTGFDLGVAVALLVSIGYIEWKDIEGFFFLGELGLDGKICKVQGCLPILREAVRQGFKKCLIPPDNVQEVSLLSGVEVYPFLNLEEVCNYFRYGVLPDEEERMIPYFCQGMIQEQDTRKENIIDFSQIRGQTIAKRALTIGAAGFHNVFLDGPSGAGKSMLAAAVAGILPEMTMEEIIESTMIYSVKGLLDKDLHWICHRPYRNPGHAITKVGLFGGGADPKPGEISLAHHGVLFLDEFTEYKKEILEMLRMPLEEHRIHLIRNERTICYPSDFLLIAASNPCPCGHYPDMTLCRCSENQIRQYANRLSGPILDRMDLFVRCERVDYKTMVGRGIEKTSKEIRREVMNVWKIQKERFSGQKGYFNGRMSASDIEKYCRISSEDHRMLERAFESYHMTGRGLNRVLKVARTIADFEESEEIRREHLEEALMFRRCSY